MKTELGRRVWVIPEGYIPAGSTGPAPTLTSHETAALLSTIAWAG